MDYLTVLLPKCIAMKISIKQHAIALKFNTQIKKERNLEVE